MLLATVLFGRTIGYGFLAYDDGLHVTDNLGLRPVSWSSWREYWRRPHQGLYMPVTYTAYAIDAWLCQGPWSSSPGGPQLSPRVFHTGNLLWHLANVVLVYLLARELVAQRGAALVAAGLFAVHPLVVESVAWVSERKGLLCATFSLAAGWLYFRARRTGAEAADGEPSFNAQRVGWLVAASACFALALLAKPQAAGWPLVLLALEWAFYGNFTRPRLCLLMAWLGLAAGVAVVTKGAQSNEIIAFITPAADRPAVAAVALAHYAGKTIAPHGLIADYGLRPEWLVAQPWLTWIAGGTITVVLAVALLAWKSWRSPQRIGLRMALGIGLAFAAALSPVLGLIPFAFQDISTVADRYAYLALVPPVLGVSWLIARWASPMAYGVSCAAIAIAALLSWQQVEHWRNDETLWRQTLRFNPASPVAYRGLGQLYAAQGRIGEAVPAFEQSLRLQSRPNVGVINNLAWIYATHPDVRWRNGAEALRLAQLITAPPLDNEPAMLDTLAAALAECGQYAEAAATAQRAAGLARRAGRLADADGIDARAALYRAGQPYREQAVYTLQGTQ